MLKRNGVEDERTPRHTHNDELHADDPVSSLPNSSSLSPSLTLTLCSPMCASSRPCPSIVIQTPTVCHARCVSICCYCPRHLYVRCRRTAPGRTMPPACHSPYASLGPPRTTLRHPSIHDSSVSASVSLRYNGRRTAAVLHTHSIYPFPPVRPSQRPHPPKMCRPQLGRHNPPCPFLSPILCSRSNLP